MITRETMRKMLLVEDLPTLPEVMGEILEVTGSESASAKELTSIVEQDHAISGRVLRLANSAFFGLRRPVNTLRDAVVVLGFHAVRMLALATSVFSTLSERQQFALDPKDFWMHSLGAAKAAQVLAKKQGLLDRADEYFTAGLLHDMGRYVLALCLKDEYRAAIETSRKLRAPLDEVERALFEGTSAEFGGWLAEKWRLPSNIVTVIRNVDRAQTYAGPFQAEVIAIALASQISCETGFGVAGDYGPSSVNGAFSTLLGLNAEQLSSAVEEVRALIEESRQFIGDLEAL